MDDRVTRVLKGVAVALAVAFVGWAVYEKFVLDVAPGDQDYFAGNRALEDGAYGQAEAAHREALAENAEHVFALRGLAQSLHQQGEHERALATYDEAIAREPDFAAA